MVEISSKSKRNSNSRHSGSWIRGHLIGDENSNIVFCQKNIAWFNKLSQQGQSKKKGIMNKYPGKAT